VAHGTGTTCPRCGTPIKRIVVRGRGTYLCPKCQPEP
jgi:formamidopyrimidine-DNA glycosylase